MDPPASPTAEGARLSTGSLPGAALFKVLQPGRCEAAFLGLKDDTDVTAESWSSAPQLCPHHLDSPGFRGAQLTARRCSWGRGTNLTNGHRTGTSCHPKSSSGDPSWHSTFGEQFALLSPPGGHPCSCSREAWKRQELRPCHDEHLPQGPPITHLPNGTDR